MYLCEFSTMITSLFLLFVAAGILFGSVLISSGSLGVIFAGFLGLFILTVVAFLLLLKRTT